MPDRFVKISDDTLHGAPGWAHKLVENQLSLLHLFQSLDRRLSELESRVIELSEWRDSHLPALR